MKKSYALFLARSSIFILCITYSTGSFWNPAPIERFYSRFFFFFSFREKFATSLPGFIDQRCVTNFTFRLCRFFFFFCFLISPDSTILSRWCNFLNEFVTNLWQISRSLAFVHRSLQLDDWFLLICENCRKSFGQVLWNWFIFIVIGL